MIKFIFWGMLFLFVACHSKKDRKYQLITNKIQQQEQDVVFGQNDAPNAIFLYASYNCKYCRYLFKHTFPDLKEKYLDKGKVKIVVKWVEFGEDPDVLYSLQAASCIYQYGSYEKYHELLLTNPAVIVSEDFQNLIFEIMERNNEIAKCILLNNNYKYLKSNVEEFRNNNLSGTPCLIINGKAFSGYFSSKNLEVLLKKEFNI
jgi:protein-disulfide isomerase